jgi:hypothetical protein
MIKYLEAVATGNEFASAPCLSVHSASSISRILPNPLLSLSKWYEKLHRVHGSSEVIVDVDKSERECLQPIQATTLSFLQFAALVPVHNASICEFAMPISKWIMHFKEVVRKFGDIIPENG